MVVYMWIEGSTTPLSAGVTLTKGITWTCCSERGRCVKKNVICDHWIGKKKLLQTCNNTDDPMSLLCKHRWDEDRYVVHVHKARPGFLHTHAMVWLHFQATHTHTRVSVKSVQCIDVVVSKIFQVRRKKKLNLPHCLFPFCTDTRRGGREGARERGGKRERERAFRVWLVDWQPAVRLQRQQQPPGFVTYSYISVGLLLVIKTVHLELVFFFWGEHSGGYEQYHRRFPC